MESREKPKAILVAIVQATGGRFNGKTRLYKAFYVAHLMHFRDQQGVLSDYPIVRMPKGPAVDEGNALLREMQQQGILATGQQPVGPYLEDTFDLRQSIGGLSEIERNSVQQAVSWIGNKTAAELSEWTHEFSNTWDETADGREMNIYADLLSESEYEEMKQQHRQVGELVDAVFA